MAAFSEVPPSLAPTAPTAPIAPTARGSGLGREEVRVDGGAFGISPQHLEACGRIHSVILPHVEGHEHGASYVGIATNPQPGLTKCLQDGCLQWRPKEKEQQGFKGTTTSK